MIVYDALAQVRNCDERLREQLNLNVRDYLAMYFSSPYFAEVPVNSVDAYHKLYYAAVGAWVSKDITAFVDSLCYPTGLFEGEAEQGFQCALDGQNHEEIPEPIMAMAAQYADELKNKTGLAGVIETLFPGEPVSYMGDDARGMVVYCEHFTF